MMTPEQIAAKIEEFRRAMPDEVMSHYGTYRDCDSMSWVLARVRDMLTFRPDEPWEWGEHADPTSVLR